MSRTDSRATEGAPEPDFAGVDDRALVTAFVAGAREAFDEIMRRHERRVYQLCYRFAGNHEDAADLTQDVFVRAFKGLRTFKGEAALGTWLHRVGVNVCLNKVTATRPDHEPLEERAHVDDRQADSFDQVAHAEDARRLQRAIQALPPTQRATVLLRVYQGLSHQEIAQALGSSVGAAKANFFHALGNLRRLLGSS
ncbi:MAG TPA: sigma-70 family RNA polymerase sigma factor [Vicinamibacterales bacterium]|nr:sigma-70 family RNA polymerase sigma factor [Vicinamibacterales bacterium]